MSKKNIKKNHTNFINEGRLIIKTGDGREGLV